MVNHELSRKSHQRTLPEPIFPHPIFSRTNLTHQSRFISHVLETEELSVEILWGGVLRLRDAATARRLD